jgi:hypothetical protein
MRKLAEIQIYRKRVEMGLTRGPSPQSTPAKPGRRGKIDIRRDARALRWGL